MPNDLTADRFEQLVNETFRISVGETSLEVALVECRRLGAAASPSNERDPFSLVFRGPHIPWLPQRTYKMENDRQLFMDKAMRAHLAACRRVDRTLRLKQHGAPAGKTGRVEIAHRVSSVGTWRLA